MRYIVLLLTISIGLFSCKGDKKKLLEGTWHSLKIESHDIDNFFVNSQKYIDTIGKNNDDATNIALYGVTNMDSLRKELQQQFDSAKAIQTDIATQTTFKFEKDSTATFSFPGGRSETGKWHVDKEGMLVLDETNENGQTEQSKVKIITLDATSLKLEFIKNEGGVTDTSWVSFKKEK